MFKMSVQNNKRLPLNYEETRLLSLNNWSGTNMDKEYNNEFKEKLARAGFHLCQKSNKIKCYYCNIGIDNWTYGDNPFIEHKIAFRSLNVKCPFITLQPTNNICFPGKESLLISEFIVLSNYTIPNNDNIAKKITFDDVRKSAKHPNFLETADRLKSFDKWPTTATVTKKELVDAGFFYIQNGDGVKCFCCGNGMSTFVNKDPPLNAHKHYYSECLFIKWITHSKASKEQMACLGRFLKKNPVCLNQPKPKESNDWIKWNEGWMELTVLLNNTDGPKKLRNEWQQQTLKDWKYNEKRKNKKKDSVTDELEASDEEIQQPSTSGYSG